MPALANSAGWFMIALGGYSAAAGIGELRLPGSWDRMIRELDQSKALQFIIGIVLVALGFAILMAMPYDPADWLSILIAVVGAGAALEGICWLAIPDHFGRIGLGLLRHGTKAWACFALVFGVAALAIGFVRLQV
ncbi:MAG: hypothetical protein R3E02_06925 [Blastomonas sp.]